MGLLRFTPLAIEDKDSVAHLLALIDKANGFAFAGLAGRDPYAEAAAEMTYGAGLTHDAVEQAMQYQERYMADKEIFERNVDESETSRPVVEEPS